MKSAKLAILVLMVCGLARAAEMNPDFKVAMNNAARQAQQYADAMLASDYATVIEFTHPKVVKLSGGKQALREALQAGMQELADERVTVEKATVSATDEPRRIGKALVSLVLQERTFRAPKGEFTREGALLAYSYDDGRTWVFAEVAGIEDQVLFHQIFPELKGIITVPRSKTPVLVKN